MKLSYIKQEDRFFHSSDVLDSPSLFATLQCHLVRHQWSVTKLAIVWIDCAKSLHKWISIEVGHKSGAVVRAASANNFGQIEGKKMYLVYVPRIVWDYLVLRTKSPMLAPRWHTSGGGSILSYPMSSEKQGVRTKILHQFRFNELSRGCSKTRSPSDFEWEARLGCSPLETSFQSYNCTCNKITQFQKDIVLLL